MSSALLPVISGRIEAAPSGGGTPTQGLTHSLDVTKEGLAMNATRDQSQPARQFVGGMQLPNPGKPEPSQADIDRLWRSAEKMPGGCWTWRLALKSSGYATLYTWHAGRKYQYAAHRVAYAATHGPIPEGMVVDHICRTRSCINPEHLRLLTHRENVAIGVGPSAINGRKSMCSRGHDLTSPDSYWVARQGKNGKRRLCKACKLTERQEQRFAAAGRVTEQRISLARNVLDDLLVSGRVRRTAISSVERVVSLLDDLLSESEVSA